MGLVSKMFDSIGQKIGEGYAKQGKSWDEVVNMPSSGSGLGKALINSSAKTGYDNYMAGRTGNQYGGIIEKATNRVFDSDLNTFKEFKQSQPQGNIQGGLAANAVNANAVGTGVIGANSKFGRSMERQLNRLADNGVISFNQTQSQGDILGTQGIQHYDSQSSAQSMNANPMLNNSIGSLGSLGKNNTNDIGISGFGNRFTTQKSNGLGNIVGYNPQGNNYNIIGGVELI